MKKSCPRRNHSFGQLLRWISILGGLPASTEPFFAGEAGQAELSQAGIDASRVRHSQQHVARFQVTMHETNGMGTPQRKKNGCQNN